MVSSNPVVRNAASCLAHVPEWVRYGSKPRREIARDATLGERLGDAARSFAEAVSYPPNRAYLGALAPEALVSIPRPWHAVHASADPQREALAPFGEIGDTALATALLARADVLEPSLVRLTRAGREQLAKRLAAHPLLAGEADRLEPGDDDAVAEALSEQPEPALPLHVGDTLVGCVRRDRRAEGRDDENLQAHHLMENLASKATGALALRWLLEREGIEADEVDYLISCGEEAVGDRYQRGGGGMAKAIGEMCGCVEASGIDVKNFCAAPANALVLAGALVKAGVYERVVVVAGGSLAKLGMKMQAALARGLPILEDVIASCAYLVTPDDGVSPVIRLEPDALGLAKIGASTSEEAVYRSLLIEPLEAMGIGLNEVDRYAPELHNAEIMELGGAGDVAHKNYRVIAAMGVLSGQLERSEMDAFVTRVGMPGFAPDQGHIPSGVAYLGHAHDGLVRGELRRVFFLAKASLFLGRVTELYDGVSFMLEANSGARGTSRGSG